MSSKAENLPPQQSSDGLRRSKRIITSEHNKLSSKFAKKTDEKPAKKKRKTKSKLGRRPKRSQTPKKDEMPNSFSSSYLTKAELDQLLLKYTRDGHFRVNPAIESPPPLVISRTIDGKIVTTKIECYDSDRQFMRDLTSSFGTQEAEAEVPAVGSKSMTVTFSRPVEESPSGSSLSTITNTEQFITAKDKHTSSGLGQSISSSDENSKSNKTSNCTQNTGTENEFEDNSRGLNLHPKTLSARENIQRNPFLDKSTTNANCYIPPRNIGHNSKIESNNWPYVVPQNSHFSMSQNDRYWNSYISVADPTYYSKYNTINTSGRCETATRPINGDHSGIESQMNFWGQIDSNITDFFETKDNRTRDSSPMALKNYPSNTTIDRTHSKDPHGIHLNLLNKYDYSNSDAARIHDSSSYQQRETNTENSKFPLQNRFSSNNERHTTGQTNSNVFGANSATITSNAMNLLPANANSYIPPRNIACSSKIESNNCPYVVPPNSHFSMRQNDRYRNSYISVAEPTYYGLYNTVNASGRCETATRPINGDQSGIESQMNFWGQIDSNNTDFCETKDNRTRDSSPMALKNYPSNTTISSNVIGTITDSETGLSKSSNEQTEDLTKIFDDSQNNDFCQSASFDNITYNNYMGESLVYNNENTEIRTGKNDFPSKLPSVPTIQTDMRPWYERSKQSDDTGNFICDFDTNKEFLDSSDCLIIE